MAHEWVAAALAGNRRAVARLITLVERGSGDSADSAELRALMADLYPHTGRAHIVGITGPPGSGKSTLVNALARTFRQQERRVGIIAVDPSSPFTGGALLGDRVRMTDLYGDPGIFIRSMASRGNLGGLALATSGAVKVLDAAGFDLILIETVGAGQAEIEIARAAHTVLVVEIPGMGDEVQSIKAGILEIADLLVVNKADRPGADATVRALRAMLQLGHPTRAAGYGGTDDLPLWIPPVIETVASTGQQIEVLAAQIGAHREWLQHHNVWQMRERERSRQELEQLIIGRLRVDLRAILPPDHAAPLLDALVARTLDPWQAADQVLADWKLTMDN